MPPQQATTLRRAKAQYKKSGPQGITPAEERRLARGVELDRRAQVARDRERRKKQAEKARHERELKENEARRQLGIGRATQLAGYSLTQKQMKGGMEGWLGVGAKKRKREGEDDVDEKENREQDGSFAEASDATTMAGDSFSSNMSLDEALLDQLDGTTENRMDDMANDLENTSEAIRKPSTTGMKRSVTTDRSPTGSTSEQTPTPPTKRAKTMGSPNDSWAQFLDGNTQILQEISQPSPPRSKLPSDATTAFTFMSTQDLELNSDDLLEAGLPKTANPALSPTDGVIIRDFAYPEHSPSAGGGSFTLKPPGAPSLPRKGRSEQSLLRSFGRRHQLQHTPQPTIATPSPKMTATCAEFSAAQCSFTSDYHAYGLSTQVLQQALDDGDDDTEDEDEDVYSQAIGKSKIPDTVLMPPPPPMLLSPRVFKPPGSGNDLFAGKGGLQILGLSTQVLNDAVSLDDDDLTDEDEDDALFSIPLQRPPASSSSSDPTTTMTTNTTPATATAAAPKTGPARGFPDLGLSTQVLHDAALDDIDFTDDDDEDTQGS